MDANNSAAESLAVSPMRAAQMLSLGRTGIFKLMRDGDLPHFKRGRRTLIPVADLRDWVARRTAEALASHTEHAP